MKFDDTKFSVVTSGVGSFQQVQAKNLEMIPLIEHLLDGFREETSLRHFVVPSDRFIVIFENSSKLAVALLAMANNVVKFLYVHKPYRRQGMATKLYKEATESAGDKKTLTFMYNPLVQEADKFLNAIGADKTFGASWADGVTGGKILVHTRMIALDTAGQPTAIKHKPWELHALPVNVYLEFSSQTTTNLNVKTQLAEMIKLLNEETGENEATAEQDYVLAVEHPSNTPIGFLTVSRAYAGKVLTGLWVKPEYRRKNIGTVLVATLVSYSHTKEDQTRITIGVNNVAASAFLKYVGFNPIEKKSPDGKVQLYVMSYGDMQRAENLEKDYKTILDSKSYVRWDGPEDVTLDGNYDLKELKALVRFIENGGPGEGRVKHEDLKQ